MLQQLGCIAFCLPTVHLGKFLLQLGGAVAVLFGHLWFGIEQLTFFHVVPQCLISHEYCVYHLIVVVFEVVLLKYGETLART